jgi:hypothetical protein
VEDKLLDSEAWSRETFGDAQLGDARRSQRLVRLASSLASAAGASPAKASTSQADLEGAYRFLRNEDVDAGAIAEAGFAATARAASSHHVLLAIEDTTTLSYRHGVAEELGDLGGKAKAKRRGYFVHSALGVSPETGATVGLLDQQYWTRETGKRGQRHQRRERAYEDKESFKWQRTAQRIRALLGEEAMLKLISVCDREADVFEYLHYKHEHSERFVVRAARDRALEVEAQSSEERRLFSALAKAPSLGVVTVEVPQRGGRPARSALLTLRAMRLTIRRPRHGKGPHRSVDVNVVLAHEENPGKGVEPLTWFLLTTEPIGNREDVLQVLHYYRLRWRIEEFHKAWKSGAGVEESRLQSAENIHRLAAILACVAVRLLQLREFAADSKATDGPCSNVFPTVHWMVLWRSVERKKPLPKAEPTLGWAFRALGRLGGWKDTKRTGRIGWEAVWDGWFRLQERLDGYYLAQEFRS